MVKDMDGNVRIRIASPADAEALRSIYAPYVENTAITFEYEVPSLEDFQLRIRRTLQRYPYLAAERDGEILGYAYTGAFVGRAAYDWAAETSIYLREDMRKQGLGRRLYQALEDISRAQNITNLYACIAWPEREDAYLTRNSVQFHAHMGYGEAGRFQKCGYKFGRWYDMVWMEKMLAGHPDVPQPLRSFPELGEEELREILQKSE